MKLEMKKTIEKDIIVDEYIQGKLHKLVITEFECTSLDWSRFWNKFEAKTDKIDLSPLSKFPYFNRNTCFK